MYRARPAGPGVSRTFRIAARLSAVCALAFANLGCLGFMMQSLVEPLVTCGEGTEAPMRLQAAPDAEGRVQMYIQAWAGVRLEAVDVTGGTVASGPLPASSVQLTLSPAEGTPSVLLHVQATCSDGSVDQRWFQVEKSADGRVSIEPVPVTSG